MFPFSFMLFPLGAVVVAIVIYSIASRSRSQAAGANKTDAEATVSHSRPAQPNMAQRPATPQASRPAATPRVQTEERTGRPAPQPQKTAAQSQRPVPKPSAPETSQAAAPKTKADRQPVNLSFNGSDALRAVLYAEIFGKPKALQ